MRRSADALWIFALLGFGASACTVADEKVSLVFPNSVVQGATNAVAVTAFEPLLFVPERDQPELVKCGSIGVFPPTSVIDPEQFASTPNLGSVLKGPREQRAYPFDGNWSIDVPKVDSDSSNNPWGAVAVFIEARGDAVAPIADGGGTVAATLLQGCFCLRTRQGTHPDRALDQAVKTACPMVGGEDEAEIEVDLEPVVPTAFRLAVRGPSALTAPRGQVVSPGPSVEVITRRCDDLSNPGTSECFRCPQPCDALDDRGRVPVQFVTAGGGATPERQIVLTDAAGFATAELSVGDCSSPVTVTAQVLGRSEEPIQYEINCVDPISEFRCDPEVPLAGNREVSSLVRVPGGTGRPDAIAILSDSGARATLEVFTSVTGPRVSLEFPERERARALHAWLLDLDEGTRPFIGVATSGVPDELGEVVLLYVFEWTGAELRPQQGGGSGGVGTPLADCAACTCPMCSCDLRVGLQTEVTLTSADLDGDRRSDLLVGTSSDRAITRYFANPVSSGPVYSQDVCRCAQFGQPPGTFEAVDFGGPNEPEGSRLLDLVIGSAGGSFVRYGEQDSGGLPELSCGQPQRFGLLAPMRDFARGRFACDPRASSDCRGYDDLVIISARTISGGSFDDPGNISVVFGNPIDISSAEGGIFADPKLAIDLLPRSFERSEPPKDPRTVEVGDLNGDGHDDVAVIYGASNEIHAWLGRSARGLGEVEDGIRLNVCGSSTAECGPLKRFALADLDPDGADEVYVVCGPATTSPKLRRYVPVLPGR